jgi:hypothetical protein
MIYTKAKKMTNLTRDRTKNEITLICFSLMVNATPHAAWKASPPRGGETLHASAMRDG